MSSLNIQSARTVQSSTRLSISAHYGAAWMLAKREWMRFFRQRNRVVAAIAQPVLFWALFGTGLRGSFESGGGESFSQFFLPGTVALIVLFTAIFATISVIEDRREGFMQAVLVSPIGRFPVLIGKVLGGAAIALAQAVAFLVLTYLVGAASPSSSLPALILLLAIMAIAMCSLGMIVAWPMESTQGFHAIMMLGLMPMWLLAGTFFPIASWQLAGPLEGQTWAQWILTAIMRANPLSYTVIELRRQMNPTIDIASSGFHPSSLVCWVVTLMAAGLAMVIAWRLMRTSHRVDTIV
ncbi:MAG: ABC transporter permease [Planctomycetota bacterium]